MPDAKRRLILAAVLAGLSLPAVAALPAADLPLTVPTGTAVPAEPGAAPALRLADDDDDDGWRRLRGRRGDHEGRRGGSQDDDHEDDEDEDDDDGDDDGRAGPRRVGPPPVQNPLIGAPRAVVN